MMTQASAAYTEGRRHPRLKMPAPYTHIKVRRPGENRYRWSGFIYDISASGVRFELDDALQPGEGVEVHVSLPGSNDKVTFRAAGHVVRVHDEADEPGPMRMAMTFDQFATDRDATSLTSYLTHRGCALA